MSDSTSWRDHDGSGTCRCPLCRHVTGHGSPGLVWSTLTARMDITSTPPPTHPPANRGAIVTSVNVQEAPETLSSDDMLFIRVSEFTDDNRRAAAIKAMEERIGGDPAAEAPGTVAWLAEQAQPMKLRKHDPDTESLGNCSCEDSTWWCEDGDSDPVPFYGFDTSDLSKAWDRSDEEIAHPSTEETSP